ncbi:MAG: hypothetical protein P4M09_31105 [Devosia sp.]|nr:hypothetical protein [Devosia sp.]
MKRSHTPLSLTLGVAGVVSILAWIGLPYLLPPGYSALLNGFYFIIPIGLMFGSLKTMRLVDAEKSGSGSKRDKFLRYTATYSRLVVGLLVLSAFGLFGGAWKIHTIHSTVGVLFLILLVIVSLVALFSSILDFRARAKNSN